MPTQKRVRRDPGSLFLFRELVDVHLFPVAVPGIFLADKRLRHLPTAATHSGRLICHRQRSPRSPSRTQKLSSCTPVAVPGILVGDRAPSSSADRCHSLTSLYLPLAALGSFPDKPHGRLPGKIGNANIEDLTTSVVRSTFLVFGRENESNLF